MDRWLLSEIMQSVYSRDDGRECCGDLRIGCVCIVLLPVYKVGVNRRVKGFFHLARGAAELDGHGALPHVLHAKTVRLKPRRELLKIGLGSAKSRAELRGRQPRVKVRRGFVLLRGEKNFEIG